MCRYVPPEGQGGPNGSQGYWKTQAPNQDGWDRYSTSGDPITADEAHPGGPGNLSESQAQQQEGSNNPLPPGWARNFGAVGIAIWGLTHSTPAY